MKADFPAVFVWRLSFSALPLKADQGGDSVMVLEDSLQGHLTGDSPSHWLILRVVVRETTVYKALCTL